MADWGEVVGAVIQVVGPLIGKLIAQGDQDKAAAMIKASVDAYGNINVPKLQALVLQQVPPSELAKLHEDPKYRAQLDAADAALAQMIQQGGLTMSDKAVLNQIRNKVSAATVQARQGLESSMSKRGTLDSGNQLAMNLSNQATDANMMNQAGQATAGQAQQRAYQAVLDRAKMGTEGLNRDFDQKARVASAQDAIAAGNTNIMNTAAKYNALIPQQNFNNEMALAAGKQAPNAMASQYYAGQAANTQSMMGGVGKGLGQAVAAGSSPSYEEWLANKKKNAETTSQSTDELPPISDEDAERNY